MSPYDPVRTADDARAFIRHCVLELVGVGFHPDEPFSEYVNVETGAPSFGLGEWALLQLRLAESIALIGDEVYEVGSAAQHELMAPDLAI